MMYDDAEEERFRYGWVPGSRCAAELFFRPSTFSLPLPLSITLSISLPDAASQRRLKVGETCRVFFSFLRTSRSLYVTPTMFTSVAPRSGRAILHG